MARATTGETTPRSAAPNSTVQKLIGVFHRFFTSPDGSEIWNVYHATSIPEGICDGQRYTMATIVNWNEDGSPDFGSAPPLGSEVPAPAGE